MKFHLLRSLIAVVCYIFSLGNLSAQSNLYLHFDGADDYVEFPNAASYLSGSNTVSMAGWFYTDELIYGQGMLSIRGGGTGNGQMYMIQLNNGSLECRVITSTGLHEVVAPAGTVVAGEWQHFALVFNQNSLELFVNGVSINSRSASGTFDSDDRPFTIGKTVQSGFNFIFKGRADEVSLWNKAISEAEISDMIDNELSGDETDLVSYYKFNQGTPGGNNQTIEELISEVGMGERNAKLLNFSLTGETSNFNGELSSGFQTINFQTIPNKLITDNPFELEAFASSGLPLTFEIVSGPATVEGNTITLSGEADEVTVKASQAGNGIFDPAADVFVSFQVLDPATTLAEVEILDPLQGDVYLPILMPIKVAVKSTIPFPDLFSIEAVEVTIDGDEVELTDWDNGHYTGWWTPSEFGTFEMTVNSFNNFGNAQTEVIDINIVSAVNDQAVTATDKVWVNADYPTLTVEANLPSYVGAYDQIIGKLEIDCPSGGCDPWDRVSSVEVQGKNGEWYEIIRYLTPYGVACDHEIDLTDFMSLLSGRTAFRVNLGTQGNGFLYTLNLEYQAGIPENAYSQVQKLWYQTYQFGDLANLQPTEDITVDYPANTNAAKIKMVSTGHGWGENNTSNAAEFNQNTHHILVNGEETFEQNNWNDCNPNPDNCSPQNGTWFHDRAGWCPGTIAQFFDYDLSPFISSEPVDLNYVFDEGYIDYCHSNNPNCVSGVTCPNCDDGFNPHLIVASYVISFGSMPLATSIDEKEIAEAYSFNLYPNPSLGRFYIELEKDVSDVEISIFDHSGRLIRNIGKNFPGKTIQVDLDGVAPGVYMIFIKTERGTGTRKLIIE